MAAFFLAHPEVKHGDICIAFTPDEEVGNGVEYFDVPGFGADFAYTVDGGSVGEIEYENFNAANLRVEVQGYGIHPGSAKGKMKNAIRMAMEFEQMLMILKKLLTSLSNMMAQLQIQQIMAYGFLVFQFLLKMDLIQSVVLTG